MRYYSEGSRRRGQADSATDNLARGLGWFSIALGLAEVAAPRKLTRALGLEGHEQLVFAYGVREIMTGIGILASRDPTPWIWGRVGGDAIDIATLTAGLSEDNPKRGNVMIAMASVLGATAADIYCAQKLSSESPRPLPPLRDYSNRSGLPRPPQEMRGAARQDFEPPEDMRTPPALRPYDYDGGQASAAGH
jgi:hypothetical protein